jgi:periplasmic glucans biosynthesis protein
MTVPRSVNREHGCACALGYRTTMRRRQLLLRALALAAAPLAGTMLRHTPAYAGALGEPQPFDFAVLKGHARALAQAPYQPPSTELPPALAKLGYEAFEAIRYRPSRGLWSGERLDFQLQFFHRGYKFTKRVRMFEVALGQAREIAYDPAMFDLGATSFDARAFPADLGFAGFRVHYHTNWDADVAAFLGASYFRAVGSDSRQYGVSARGLAIGTGSDHAEEFPDFTAFWFERPPAGSNRLTFYALLDSPSAAGAYRFDLYPGSPLVMDIDVALYARNAIQRLGIAPLTSMYLCGENDRRVGDDWRPEIHDSDGLSMQTGTGEWIWRPLTDPPDVHLYSYVDRDPRGFGLLQRDHTFDHYQDDGAHYEQRPSAWVAPRSRAGAAWGEGAVMLLEYAARDETVDNIAAFWVPARAPSPGDELLFSYQMRWGLDVASGTSLGRVVSTRTGIGGVVGRPRTHFSWRFAVDFVGGELATIGKDVVIEPVIETSRGKIELTSARPQFEIKGCRAMFDLALADDSTEPIDLRMYLRVGMEPLTETWIYQWIPPPPDAREKLWRSPAK